MKRSSVERVQFRGADGVRWVGVWRARPGSRVLELPGAVKAARAEAELAEARRKVAATVPLAQHKVPARIANLVRHPTGAPTGEVTPAMSASPRAIECVETADPFDRAHDQRGSDGFLLPAAVGDGRRRGVLYMLPEAIARPRRYPRCYTVSGDAEGNGAVCFESVYDATREAEERLEGVPGIGRADLTPAQARDRLIAQMQASLGNEKTRAILRQRTREKGSRE